MQAYYFYQQTNDVNFYIQKQLGEQAAEFIWVDCRREDVVNDAENWQKKITALTGLNINEFHVRDILNLEHPCVFDTLEDYDLLIFRKLITPNDEISLNEPNEQHERLFGLETSPIVFIITSQVLITIRETGNRALENYVHRVETISTRKIEEQNNPRKLATSPLDLALRLLNSVIDDYLELRIPLTKRVEYWQQALLQGNQRFKKWHQLLHENMAFQQIENLCEEQIEALQEFRDDVIENYQHIKGRKSAERQDIMLVRINDLCNHIERIQSHTIRFRNAIQAAMNLHFSAISNQTNENMRILAIITAVFAPLTLLTGIYGMNFEFIPGLKSPHGFWIMLLLMLLSTILLIYYFYRQHLVGRGEKSVIDLLAQQHRDQRVNMFWFLDYEPIKQTMKEVGKLTRFK
ncbi:magnesium transporter CorA family protein [Acinetobacter rudis]|uniref:Magnesium transporter CorA family protein n=1 Tax=Acinetobacter rudis TaxID=632955 RepID=A0AAW8JC53_9GAMM|nr:magnesium transporter CorA family protein [Acinetobacter rudis]MDQ8935274.1 magnesium transporter CorA family protein [Acinetobacter rudis]MDQ8952739.1 magnesium transporter CorA family protein [Acinetobacter rudis]MDQ9017531.1 magnesium transporter CorA family protein [Acinetobacter rudis]